MGKHSGKKAMIYHGTQANRQIVNKLFYREKKGKLRGAVLEVLEEGYETEH